MNIKIAKYMYGSKNMLPIKLAYMNVKKMQCWKSTYMYYSPTTDSQQVLTLSDTGVRQQPVESTVRGSINCWA